MPPSPRRRLLARVLIAIVIAIVTVIFVLMAAQFKWAGNAGHQLTTLVPQGTFSSAINTLVDPVFFVAGVVGVLVIGAIGFITWKFRERPDDDGEFPVQLHGKTSFEIGWTALPALILAAVGVFTVMTLIDLNKPEPQAMQVEVSGQQWWWAYHYDLNHDGNYKGDADITTATELVIPVGKVVELSVTSNDVIHSFWIPALNGKRDAVPGQHHPWKIQADHAGVFRGQCTEFCGLSHANMRMIVRALPQDEFDLWVANQLRTAVEPAAGSEAAAGKAVFLGQLCSSCHLINGVNNEKVADPKTGVAGQLQSGVAPDLTHLMSRGTFIGSIQNLYAPDDPNDPSLPGDPNNVSLPGNPRAALVGGPIDEALVNRPALESWLRNPPGVKPASAVPNKAGLLRGMPNLGLTEVQIDQLIAYLTTLK
ncbi:MAG: cytochrome c oxidase subunit II [Actinomycetes bacterium]